MTQGDRKNKAKILSAKKRFAAAEASLLMRGHDPVNPFKVIPDTTGMTWEDCMKLNIKAMMDCDAIHQLPGWHESKGALLEHKLAQQLLFESV